MYLETTILAGLPVTIEFFLDSDRVCEDFKIVEVNGNNASIGLQNKLKNKIIAKEQFHDICDECQKAAQEIEYYDRFQ